MYICNNGAALSGPLSLCPVRWSRPSWGLVARRYKSTRNRSWDGLWWPPLEIGHTGGGHALSKCWEYLLCLKSVLIVLYPVLFVSFILFYLYILYRCKLFLFSCGWILLCFLPAKNKRECKASGPEWFDRELKNKRIAAIKAGEYVVCEVHKQQHIYACKEYRYVEDDVIMIITVISYDR